MKDLAIELREIVDEYDTLSVSRELDDPRLGRGGGGEADPDARTADAGGGRLDRRRRRRGRLVGPAAGRRESAASVAFQTMRMSTQTSRGDVLDTVISPDGRYLACLPRRTGPAASACA